MILKNLLRRKGRTLLTIAGLSIGVAAIITLGALADGLEAGYGAVLSGSQADLVLSQPDAYDITLSSIDEDVGEQIAAMPEVKAVSPLIQGIVQTTNAPYFFVFGYPEHSFVLDRFQIVQGVALYSKEAQKEQGRPLILGSAAAESTNKKVGDIIRLGDSAFRVVGIYETGEAFEEGGAVVRLDDAQILMGMPRKVSVFYIKLKDPRLSERLQNRIERLYPDLLLSTAEDLADRNTIADSLRAMFGGISALAILIGGVGMMNSQLMSVFERTREIGVLRAVGWRSIRILLMILGESILVCLLGGVLGAGLAWAILFATAKYISAFGATTSIQPGLLIQAFGVVFTLGLVGGLYPAYRASRLQPVEALRYEGGSLGHVAHRLPVGGMAVQNLWRRKARTFLTLGMVGITAGAIMTLNAILGGAFEMVSQMVGGAEIVLRKAGVADTGFSFIDERIGERIDAMPEVRDASGVIMTATLSQDMGLFLLLGYSPREAAIRDFQVVAGERVSSNRQIMIGRQMADAQDIKVGNIMTLNQIPFRVVGIYEHSIAAYEMGGVVTLRDAQAFSGRPRKVTLFLVDLYDPSQARAVVERINRQFPEVHASLAGEFASQMPDMQNTQVMTDSVAVIAILVGGIGLMNTMLMTVLERTREIGALRALGWRRRAVLGLILRESLALGALGAVAAIGIAFGLAGLLSLIPFYGNVLIFSWDTDVFVRSLSVALALALVGGLYPAYRATRLEPVEALRYE